MKNHPHGPGLPEIEHDYRAITWRHIPALLAAIHDELHELNMRHQSAGSKVPPKRTVFSERSGGQVWPL